MKNSRIKYKTLCEKLFATLQEKLNHIKHTLLKKILPQEDTLPIITLTGKYTITFKS